MKNSKNSLILWFILLIFVLILGVVYYNQQESYMPQPNPILPPGPYAMSMVVSDPDHSASNKLVTVSTDGTVVINPTIGPFPIKQGFENKNTNIQEGLSNFTTSPPTTRPPTTAPSVSVNPTTYNGQIQSGPATATISVFNIDHFNVDPKWSEGGTPPTTNTGSVSVGSTSTATPTPFQPYTVSTTITFNVSGIGFANYDLWMNNGSTNSNNVGSNSQFTCVKGACGTCSILPNCPTINPTNSVTVTPTNSATTKPTNSATTNPTSIPTGTGSTYTSTKQTITSVSVTLNENLYYTVWLILYDANGNVITSTCPNTVIQILPSFVNNPSMYLNYTFSYSYFLIGGGGGGGQAGSVGNGSCGNSGQIVVSNKGTVSKPGYVMVLVDKIVQTKPITGQNSTFVYTTDVNNNLNIMGGKGGSSADNSLGQGASGMAGADAKIDCKDMDNFPIVAKGGLGGQGGNSMTNSAVCKSSNGDVDGRGEGGSGGVAPSGKGGDGYMGYENINIYYFLVTGGTNANNPPTIGPTPCAVCSTSCAEVGGGGSSNLMGYNISQAGEINFAIPLSFVFDPVSSSSPWQLDENKFPLFRSSFVLEKITSDNVITVQSNADLTSTTITVIPNRIPNIIPLPEFSSYSAWQFQVGINEVNVMISPTLYPSTPSGTSTDRPVGVTTLFNVAGVNEYQKDIGDTLIGDYSYEFNVNDYSFKEGFPVSIQSKFSLSNSIQIQNNNTLQFMSNTPSARSIQIYPSNDFLNSPGSFPVSYNPAFIYQKNDSTNANGRIWTPVNIYETYVPKDGGKNTTIYLGVWYLYMDNMGSFKGFYHDCQKSSVGTPISKEWEELNALQYKPGMVYTIYFFQTDGIVSMFDIVGN